MGRKARGIYQVGTLTIQDMYGDYFLWALTEDIDGLLEQGHMAAVESYKAQVWEDGASACKQGQGRTS